MPLNPLHKLENRGHEPSAENKKYILSAGATFIMVSPLNDTFTHFSSRRTLERGPVPVKLN
tara:strand:- start:171 stop:353 length:183 start_codon:yes stop_codon:yes gene_type:complete